MTIKEFQKAYEKLEVVDLGDRQYSYVCPKCSKRIVITHEQVVRMICKGETVLCDDCNKEGEQND